MKIRKGSKYLIFFVVIFVALPPFAIDTYIPAFGNISDFLNVDVSKMTITVSTYLVGFGIGMLIWGALSDRYGRKKILILGMLIYTISTVLCSLSSDFETLTFMRFIQGLGDSPAAVASMAILKDCYRGQKLIKMMATMIMVFMIAPIISPIIGSLIIYTTGQWQNIFHFLTLYGVVLLCLTFIMPETHKPHKRSSSLLQSFYVYVKHTRNIPFILGAIGAGLCFGALFSFINASSNLIIEYFNLGYLQYCILFAVNIFGIVFASYYIKKNITPYNQNNIIFSGYFISTIVIVINIICSYVFSNIYLFVLLNTIATACFALINITLTSKIIDLLKEGFAAGNAINRLVKFTVAGIGGIILSFYSITELMVDIPVQQLGFIILSLVLFLRIKDKLFPKV
ncbi:multidrug effflux MFS transporter [Allofrancisella guangzhouensis]|uniref:Bcr/CflA family efflux transporter n=1 Tax=Allofrancisella guangzhouensis TaxID=594679 RepID=A0A0A8E4W1_9GAMM|nr:multidrug effflux MFS transporter [Allofrancisella guangzhouensis]AJC49038.1 major facilitator transporter [Allofrancisella guangzhouensis]MBK2026791.1 multidrug effflux MFS transporter [Allofrancisella guangzhouensis]MBK2043745.1 multidrug effflux MFS transporter [Allofrancisella guangzhouensis]MBK2045321.1 multidrug effflux MFS transporter [Allofrancisella guangzhouensis]